MGQTHTKAPTRAAVVAAYSQGVTVSNDATRGRMAARLATLREAGKARGLLDTGPDYSRPFRGYLGDAAHAVRIGDAVGADYWLAHAAYLLAEVS